MHRGGESIAVDSLAGFRAFRGWAVVCRRSFVVVARSFGLLALLWRYVAYTIARMVRAETKVRISQAALMFGLLGASLLPVAIAALALNRQAPAYVIGPVPSLNDLTTEIKLGLIAGSCTLAVLAARWFGWPQNPEPVCSPSSLLLIVCWWLLQPLCLFGFSWITANSVFVPRYMFIALPGAALMATAIAAPFLPPV